MNEIYFIYANWLGRFVHVDNVQRGKMCGCKCPVCGQPVIARQGPKNRHGFAHINASTCNPHETILHILSKNTLAGSDHIIIPPSPEYPLGGGFFIRPFPETFEFKYDHTLTEAKIGNFIADVLLTNALKKKDLIVEIQVSHEVDETKLEKIKQTNISAIQIDLSHYQWDFAPEKLKNDLINGLDNKQWLCNQRAAKRIIAATSKSGHIDLNKLKDGRLSQNGIRT